MAHEIAHQWFGDMATETEWAHIWLSEGFATYMTILYFENKYGQDTARKMLITNRNQVVTYSKQSDQPVVDFSAKDYMTLLNPNSYQKGGWVLHMLRNQLGDAAFWKGIQAYYAAFAGKNASTDDLRRAMEKASGQDLQPFFRQWLYKAGHPILSIDWKYQPEKKSIDITIYQKQPVAFQFPLELSFTGQDQQSLLTQTVWVKEPTTHLTIPVSGQPIEMVADPSVKLLFEYTQAHP